MKIICLLVLLTSCAQPVVRDGAKPEASAAMFKMPDLKKRLWLFPVLLGSKVTLIESIPADQMLQAELYRVLGDEHKSPFLIPAQSEFSLNDYGLTAQSNTDDIARAARTVGASGFMFFRISELEWVDGEQGKGLLESTSHQLSLRLDFELFDSTTGRRLLRGHERKTLDQQRSAVLGRQASVDFIRQSTETLVKDLSQMVFNRLAPFSENLGWNGRILKMESSRAYINAGRRSGLKLDDILKVLEPSRNVFDSETGQLVGAAPGRIKGTLKIIQYFGDDGSIAAIQSGGGFTEGDLVELY